MGLRTREPIFSQAAGELANGAARRERCIRAGHTTYVAGVPMLRSSSSLKQLLDWPHSLTFRSSLFVLCFFLYSPSQSCSEVRSAHLVVVSAARSFMADDGHHDDDDDEDVEDDEEDEDAADDDDYDYDHACT